MTMDKGQRTKDKGHRISQSVIKNKIGMTKYGIKKLLWYLLFKYDEISRLEFIRFLQTTKPNILTGEAHFI